MNATAYAENIRFDAIPGGGHLVIDEAASVGKKYPVVLGHVATIRGFGHFVGDRYTHLKGFNAVVALGPANSMDPLAEALRSGLANGRDDRS
jgi:hypothetical protein